MKISARNQLAGKVVDLKKGPVHTEVTLELKGGETITAVITTGSAESLGLTVGKAAVAIIKASTVIVGVE